MQEVFAMFQIGLLAITRKVSKRVTFTQSKRIAVFNEESESIDALGTGGL